MNANLMTKKIEMTKSEAKEAGKLNTEKFHELRQFMAAWTAMNSCFSWDKVPKLKSSDTDRRSCQKIAPKAENRCQNLVS